jgi:hypothetical protein
VVAFAGIRNDLVDVGMAKVDLQPGSRALQYVLCDRDSCDTEGGAQ